MNKSSYPVDNWRLIANLSIFIRGQLELVYLSLWWSMRLGRCLYIKKGQTVIKSWQIIDLFPAYCNLGQLELSSRAPASHTECFVPGGIPSFWARLGGKLLLQRHHKKAKQTNIVQALCWTRGGGEKCLVLSVNFTSKRKNLICFKSNASCPCVA